MVLRLTSLLTVEKTRFSLRSSSTALGLLVGAAIAPSGAGCGGALGGECVLDSDCNDGPICAHQFCHAPCNVSSDCKVNGEVRLQDNEPKATAHNHCAVPPDCTFNSDCGESRVCEQAKCRDSCVINSDCLDEQLCYHGGCRDTTNSTGRWMSSPGSPATGGSTASRQNDILGRSLEASSESVTNRGELHERSWPASEALAVELS